MLRSGDESRDIFLRGVAARGLIAASDGKQADSSAAGGGSAQANHQPETGGFAGVILWNSARWIPGNHSEYWPLTSVSERLGRLHFGKKNKKKNLQLSDDKKRIPTVTLVALRSPAYFSKKKGSRLVGRASQIFKERPVVFDQRFLQLKFRVNTILV